MQNTRKNIKYKNNEENIKTYLDSLAHQESYSTSLNFHHTYTLLQKSNQFDQSSFNEISDWNDNSQLQQVQSLSLPKLQNRQKNKKKDVDKDLGRYKSELLELVSVKKTINANSLNPRLFQFNSHIYSHSQKKSQLFFHKVLRLDDHKKLQKTIKIKKANQGPWPHGFTEVQINKIADKSICETKKKSSGILRKLKYRQKIYQKRNKKDYPEALKGIKFIN